MDGWKNWRKRILAAVGAAGLMILAAPDLRAEMVHGSASVGFHTQTKSEIPNPKSETNPKSQQENSQSFSFRVLILEFVSDFEFRISNFTHARSARTPNCADGKALLAALRQEWEAIREDLTRSVLETTLTLFFIRGGSPPPSSNDQGQLPPPPDQAAGPPPPPPPPPPPTGTSEDQPGDVGNPPPVPPQGTPEPASIVTALLGAGLASLYGSRPWRRIKVK
jgi:hypothetical protein